MPAPFNTHKKTNNHIHKDITSVTFKPLARAIGYVKFGAAKFNVIYLFFLIKKEDQFFFKNII